MEDIKENYSHVIVMSTYLNESEKQDIAFITIEKTGDGKAELQIEGDKDLFPNNSIVEPNSEDKGAVQHLKAESNVAVIDNSAPTVNVWVWPSVRYLYAPTYVVWASPYRWRAYPRWWRPWRPVRYSSFYAYGVHYRPSYHFVNVRRGVAVRNVYYPRRHSSVLVVHNRRNTTVIHNYRKGNVKGTRVKGTRGRARR